MFSQGQPIIMEGGKLPARGEAPVEIEFPSAQQSGTTSQVGGPASEAAPPIGESGPTSLREGELTITQVAGSYLVAVGHDAVYLIDQHEAHERILFEKLYRNATEGLGKSSARQNLLFPLRVRLSPSEIELAGDILPALVQLGFSAKHCAPDNLEISGVPMVLVGRVDSAFVHGVLEDLSSGGVSKVLAERVKLLASIMACRAAIKGNAPMNQAEQRELVRQLLNSESSLSCPHGSPTVIRLGLDELRRMFLR